MIFSESRSGGLGLALSLFGMAVVAVFLVQEFAVGHIPSWVFVAGVVGVVAWLVANVVLEPWRLEPLRHGPAVALGAAAASGVMVVTGSIGAAPSNGLLLVPCAVGILRLVASLRVPLWVGAAAALTAVVGIAVGSLTVTMGTISLLALMGGAVLGFLGGLNRRQARQADARERELLERTIAAREDHAKATVLEARQAVARDIHDVLAHSLGGLVIQLDAVEALLESGRTADAASRIRDARGLAASGLSEARRAVEALREPQRDALVSAEDFGFSLDELVRAHRGLGGTIDLVQEGAPRGLAAESALALRRALQESLSNARKHAPGSAVHVRVTWEEDRVMLEARNRLAAVLKGTVPSGEVVGFAARAGGVPEAEAALAASGGGHGLRGMAERFDALPGGSVTAAERDGVFVVRAVVRVAVQGEAQR